MKRKKWSGVICLAVLLCIASLYAQATAQETVSPDPVALLDQATASLREGAQWRQYELHYFDGHGNETVANLRWIENAIAGKYASLVKIDGEKSTLILTKSEKDSFFEQVLVKGRKTRVLSKTAKQTPIDDMGVWPFDFADLISWQSPKFVGGVNLSGKYCWLVNVELPKKLVRNSQGRVWVDKKTGRILQTKWFDKKKQPVHQKTIQYSKDDEGKLIEGKISIRSPQKKGAWTRLDLVEIRSGAALSMSLFSDESLTKKNAFDKLWQ